MAPKRRKIDLGAGWVALEDHHGVTFQHAESGLSFKQHFGQSLGPVPAPAGLAAQLRDTVQPEEHDEVEQEQPTRLSWWTILVLATVGWRSPASRKKKQPEDPATAAEAMPEDRPQGLLDKADSVSCFSILLMATVRWHPKAKQPPKVDGTPQPDSRLSRAAETTEPAEPARSTELATPTEGTGAELQQTAVEELESKTPRAMSSEVQVLEAKASEVKALEARAPEAKASRLSVDPDVAERGRLSCFRVLYLASVGWYVPKRKKPQAKAGEGPSPSEDVSEQVPPRVDPTAGISCCDALLLATFRWKEPESRTKKEGVQCEEPSTVAETQELAEDGQRKQAANNGISCCNVLLLATLRWNKPEPAQKKRATEALAAPPSNAGMEEGERVIEAKRSGISCCKILLLATLQWKESEPAKQQPDRNIQSSDSQESAQTTNVLEKQGVRKVETKRISCFEVLILATLRWNQQEPSPKTTPLSAQPASVVLEEDEEEDRRAIEVKRSGLSCCKVLLLATVQWKEPDRKQKKQPELATPSPAEEEVTAAEKPTQAAAKKSTLSCFSIFLLAVSQWQKPQSG